MLRHVNISIESNNIFKRKLTDNYKEVKRFLRYAKQPNIIEIFDDGIQFAKSIIDNEDLINELNIKNKISTLVFGLSNLDLVTMIYKNGIKYGVKGVNIEHWTTLIYFYYAIRDLKNSLYTFPENNSFLTIIKVGDKNKSKITDNDDENVKTIFNGFSTYYRVLFSIAIFADGKAISLDNLDRISSLDINKIKSFLSKFCQLITLNYDSILELITAKKVEHLHGKFKVDQRCYVYNQSFCIELNGLSVEFSDVLVGDYFVFKTFLAVVNNLASKSGNNIELEPYHKIIKPTI